MAGCQFRTLQNFLDECAYMYQPQLNIRSFIDFMDKRRLNVIYDSPDNEGECKDLSRKRIKKACVDGYKNAFRMLFGCAMLFKGTARHGSKRASLVSHTAYTADEIMCIIHSWEAFFNYLYMHRLVLSIYEDPDMAFMACETKTVLILEYKDYMKDDPPISECEIIRVYSKGEVLQQRYLISTNRDDVHEMVIDDIEVKFVQITINQYGVWSPPDPYDKSRLSRRERLMLL